MLIAFIASFAVAMSPDSTQASAVSRAEATLAGLSFASVKSSFNSTDVLEVVLEALITFVGESCGRHVVATFTTFKPGLMCDHTDEKSSVAVAIKQQKSLYRLVAI